MATIKSCTDLEQSRKLAEILPLESADMYWSFGNIKFMDNDQYGMQSLVLTGRKIKE